MKSSERLKLFFKICLITLATVGLKLIQTSMRLSEIESQLANWRGQQRTIGLAGSCQLKSFCSRFVLFLGSFTWRLVSEQLFLGKILTNRPPFSSKLKAN